MKTNKAKTKELVEQILEKYNELTIVAPKLAQLELVFQERYRAVIKNKMNEYNFLSEEFDYICLIVEKQKEQLAAKTQQASAMEDSLENYTKRIENYKPLIFPGYEHNIELARLFGAVAVLERDYWSLFERFFHERFPIYIKNPLEPLSQQLSYFISSGSQHIPPALKYYRDYVERKDKLRAEHAANDATKDIGFLLNDVFALLNREKFDVENPAYCYIKALLRDFRLTEFKRQNF